MIMIMMTIMIIIVSTPALQVSLDPEHDNTNLKIGPKNTMEIAILNDDDPGKKKTKTRTKTTWRLLFSMMTIQTRGLHLNKIVENELSKNTISTINFHKHIF